jgi:UDP-glucose 4-epimerase
MKILITGSEGVLAQQVIPILIDRGFTIVGVDNLSKHNIIKNTGNYTFINGDLTDPVFTNTLFTEYYDYVFHFAAIIYGVLWYNKYPADVLANNVSMTSNILTNYENIGKMVYTSSSMVYERSAIVPNKEEDADISPVMTSSYGLSKYVCERLIKHFHEQHNLDYLIWRPFNIFDITEKLYDEEGKGHVFSDFVNKIVVKKQQPLSILGDGEQRRSFIDIRDAAYAIATFSTFEKSNNKTYNLGSETDVSIKELAALIAEEAKELKLLDSNYELHFNSSYVHQHDVKKRVPDTTNLSTDFSWEPQITIATSINNYLINTELPNV